MSNHDPDQHALAVLQHFPYAATGEGFVAVGGLGGLSGAAFWKGDVASTPCLLRGWPPGFAAERLTGIHDFLRHAADSGFRLLPLPLRTCDGQTHVTLAGRVWELCPLLPGSAVAPSGCAPQQIEHGAATLARLHLASRGLPGADEAIDIPPALRKRDARLAQALRGWRAKRDWSDPHGLINASQARDLSSLVWELLPRVAGELASVSRQTVQLQTIHGDPRREHLLFTEGEVTGVVDFGAVTFDSPMVDLARWLGEAAPADPDAWRRGVEAYHALRPIDRAERRLLPVLATSGAVLAACNWLDWARSEQLPLRDPLVARRRITEVVQRVELLAAGRHAAAPESGLPAR